MTANVHAGRFRCSDCDSPPFAYPLGPVSNTTKDKKKEGVSFDLLSRENLEALTMAILMAVMLKYFVVEAYKIPTGSMQPTLIGDEKTGIFDRILVDKFSYHFRDPERYEVVVFKYPLDQSKNFIKRTWGLPNEEIDIRDGNVFRRANEREEWKVLRRPRPIQLEMWKRINPANARFASWSPAEGASTWRTVGRSTVMARGDGAVRLPNDGGSVFDDYGDGYSGDLGSLVRQPTDAHGRPTPDSQRNPVGDLRLTGEVSASNGCASVTIELREGDLRHRFEIPGPAAPGDARPRISSESTIGRTSPLEAHTTKAWKLPAGKRLSFAAQNLDDELQLEIDGEIVLTLEIPGANDQRSNFVLRAQGEGADFTELEAWRDVFYFASRDSDRTTFKIPDGCYVMLGDNTQNSSDCRAWQFAQYRWPGEGSGNQFVRGNQWVNGNPATDNPVRVPEAPGRARIFFRDEWGDLHDFVEQPDSAGPLLPASFVPRRLITGRAVAVFWPINSLAARLKWIH